MQVNSPSEERRGRNATMIYLIISHLKKILFILLVKQFHRGSRLSTLMILTSLSQKLRKRFLGAKLVMCRMSHQSRVFVFREEKYSKIKYPQNVFFCHFGA